MKRRPWEVSRRALLGGAGAMIGLPLLEAMIPGMKVARADAPTRPKRVVFVTFGTGTPDYRVNGGSPGLFWPSATGTDYALSPILQPLADLKSDVLVVNGLHNNIGRDSTGGVITDHPSAAFSILTATNVKTFGVNAISVDQVAANALGQYTPTLPSLFVDSMYEPNSYDYLGWLSWTGPTSPRLPILDSARAFREVFGDTTLDDGTRQRLRAYKKSVLDQVKTDADRLQSKLGKADRESLDQYLSSVRSLEKRVSATAASCNAGTPLQDPGTRPERTKQLMDLLVLSFQCDRTRVGTFMLGQTGLYTSYSWLGEEFNRWIFHDDISHGADEEKFSPEERQRRLAAYAKVTTWNVEQFAYLVRKLKETPEGDGSGSLLDNTILVCTSEMSYGHGHFTDRIPVIVAGRAGGSAVTLGRYIDVPEQPIANLYVTMLNAVGVDTARFGNSTGTLSLT